MDNIKVLIKFYDFNNFFVGLGCMKIENDKLKLRGRLYKIFACVIALIATIDFLKCCYLNIWVSLNLLNFSVVLTFSFNGITVFFAYILMFSNIIFWKPYSKLKIYEKIVKIDQALQFGDIKINTILQKNILFVYTSYFIFKIINVIYHHHIWPEFYMGVYHYYSIAIDLQILNFILEISMLSRRFEILRCRLNKFASRNVDLEFQDCVVTYFWKIHHEPKYVNSTKLLWTFNKLTDLIDDMNSFYSSMVKCCYIKSISII